MIRITKTNRDIWSESRKYYYLPFGIVVEMLWERLYKIDGGDVCVDKKVWLKRIRILGKDEAYKLNEKLG